MTTMVMTTPTRTNGALSDVETTETFFDELRVRVYLLKWFQVDIKTSASLPFLYIFNNEDMVLLVHLIALV